MDFVQRGQSMVARGQYQEAVKTCRLGLLANPTNVEGRLVLGRALVALRRYDEVLAEMRVALEVDSTSAPALALRGEALLRKGDAIQAAEVLREASGMDPADEAISALLQEAEISAAAADDAARPREKLRAPTFDSPAESMTKHYPAHRGLSVADAGGSNSITKPTTTDGPPTAQLAVGDKSGTMELDPDLDGVEMLDAELDDDLDDPPIDPPGFESAVDRPTANLKTGSGPSEVSEVSEVMELSGADLIEDSDVKPAPRLGPAAAEDPTAAYRRDRFPGLDVPSDFTDEAPTVARDEFAGEAFPTVGTAPETPSSKPEPRPVAIERGDPSALVRSAKAIDELFPEDESGVSKLEMLDEPAGPARRGRSRTADMQLIRNGLLLGERPVEPGTDPRFDATEHVRRKKSAKPSGQARRSPALETEGKGKRRKVAEVDRTMGVPRRRKRSPVLYVYLLLAIAVGAGSVFLGLMWREQRRAQQIESAERNADKLARRDTYDAYLEASRIYQEIADLHDTSETRSALARIKAAIAAEFGAGRAEVGDAVDALGDANNADALAARAYAALARADAGAARTFADQLAATHPEDPMAPYLRGRALLLADESEKAAEAFREALRRGPRPLVFVGLGLAEEARGRVHESIAAFDRAIDLVSRHPAAVIHRARVAARSGQLREGDEPEATLVGLIDGASGNVSPEQRAWASLSLAEVQLARGDRKAAAKALDQARESRPPASWPFTEALIRGLLSVGRMDDARAEAKRAASDFSGRVEPNVFLARVAIERRDPDDALEALKKAGDLSGNAEALAIRGRAHLAKGELEKAAIDLDAALGIDADLQAAQAARAELDLRKGDAKAAAEALEKIYREGGPIEIALTYAAALREVGRKLDARGVLRELEKRPNAGARVFLELARLERAEGKMREAREYYTKAIQASPSDIEPRLEAALLAFDTGDRAGAREAFEALIIDASDDGSVLVEAARVMSMAGAPARAKELIDRADKAGAPRWKLAREQGRAHIKRGQFADAVTSLEKAVSLRPEDGETRILLIDAHLYREDEEAAKSALRGILKAFPTGAEPQLAKGRLDLYKDRIGEALTAFKKARRLLEQERASPRELGDASQWIGRVYYFDGKALNARKSLNEAVALDPSNADAYYFLGLVELDARRWSAAMKAFGKSTEIDGVSNPEAWFYLGESAYKARKWRSAKKAYKRFLELRPNGELSDDARRALRRLR